MDKIKIVVATHNAHKAKEIKALFSKLCQSDVLTLSDVGYDEDIIEDGKTFEENALIKARVAANLGDIGIADDSGLCVDALGGAPGIYSARYAGEPSNDEKNNAKLLDALKNADNRCAAFVSVIGCVLSDGTEFTVRGECRGMILQNMRGEGGFGYDPLFYYEPLKKTFAELSEDEKNAVSHRACAMKNFAEKFKEIIQKN
ncbi:MAG: XTP/dITP diphosphatase [Clostridia bacterium]|nr:XTP/dITP diphosphatase [Clostridia bacterium]